MVSLGLNEYKICPLALYRVRIREERGPLRDIPIFRYVVLSNDTISHGVPLSISVTLLERVTSFSICGGIAKSKASFVKLFQRRFHKNSPDISLFMIP